MSVNAPSPAICTLLLLTAFALAPAQGCFVVIEEDESITSNSDVVLNNAPTIVTDLSWWTCDYSPFDGDYLFEFQAVVDDLDGWSDVAEVNIYFFESGSPTVQDSFSLHYEGEGVWGGMVLEGDSSLYCGGATDAIIEAWDYFDDSDYLSIVY